MFFKKGTKVKLTKDHTYHQTIFGNSEVENGATHTLLKKGRSLTVTNHTHDGEFGVVDCVRNGAYYEIPEEILTQA